MKRLTVVILAWALLVGASCGEGSEAPRAPLDRQPVGWGKADGASCGGFCGGESPAGCWCDEQCAKYNDCCSDKVEVCDQRLPSCQGACGGRSTDGCWCDDQCVKYGDCCPDRATVCDAPSDPCAAVDCDTPPVPVCSDASTLRTFAASGTCSAGSCSYPASETTCEHGCADGACLTSPGPYGFQDSEKHAALGTGQHTVDLTTGGLCKKNMKTYFGLRCAGWVQVLAAGGQTTVALSAMVHEQWYSGHYQDKYNDPNVVPSQDKYWTEHARVTLDANGEASYELAIYSPGFEGVLSAINARYSYTVKAVQGAITVDYKREIHPYGCHPDTETCHYVVLAPPPAP